MGSDSSKERDRWDKREFILHDHVNMPCCYFNILHALLASLGVYANLVHKEQEIQCKVKEGGSTKGG